ncbi:MAG: TIGR03016 family PEP-CTERM system-associated outer membrane protein [Gammaproteobacteria bacterium]|nr:TIGR03016 family PEP-CTERM system-associated outer membrane protein [Gammaproteobacteria bacterium]
MATGTIMWLSRVSSLLLRRIAGAGQVAGTVVIASCTCVWAGDWTLTPRFNVEETFTDNVALAGPGRERHEFITSVEPGLSVRGEGKRLQFNLEYNMEVLVYQRDATPNAINQQLQSDASAELLEKVAFVDLRATRSQQNANSFVRTAADNLSATGNSSEVTTYRISPYARHHLGDFADAELRYTIDGVTNESNGARNTSRSATSALTLTSGAHFSRAKWRIDYSRQRVINLSGSINRFRRVQGELRYRFSRRYGALVRLGKERNEFPSSQPSTGSNYWSFGLTWTPSSRTTVEGEYGKRFFGHRFGLNLSHRTRRTLWTASFTEQPTQSRQLQLERVLVPLQDALGNPVPDPATGTQVGVPVDTVNPTDEVLVRSRFDGAVDLFGRRTTGRIAIFSEARRFQVSGNLITVDGTTFNFNRSLTPKDTLSIMGLYQVRKNQATNQKDERMSMNMRYAHSFGPDFRGTIGFNKVKQNSSSANNEFDEHRMSIGVLTTF